MDTRELVRHILTAKGMSAGDRVLTKAVAYRLIHALRQQVRRDKLTDAGRRRGVRVWALPEQGCSNSTP